MPIKHHWEENGFHLNAWGVVTELNIQERNRAFSNSHRCDSCYYHIFDGREVEGFENLERCMTAMASNDIGMSSYVGRIAIVFVSSEAVVLSAFRRYVDICTRSDSQWSFHLCETLQEANHLLRQVEEQRPRRPKRSFPQIDISAIRSEVRNNSNQIDPT